MLRMLRILRIENTKFDRDCMSSRWPIFSCFSKKQNNYSHVTLSRFIGLKILRSSKLVRLPVVQRLNQTLVE